MAIGGHKQWAEELRNQGADIRLIAQGAAIRGDKDWVEALGKNGADISVIIREAATGGHQKWAEALRTSTKKGKEDFLITWGAAIGGHKEWVEALRKNPGADIHHIALGAVCGGHLAYVRYLEDIMNKEKKPVQPLSQDIAVIHAVLPTPSSSLSRVGSEVPQSLPKPSVQQNSPQQGIAQLRGQVEQLQTEKQALSTALASRDITIQSLEKDKQQLETDKQNMQLLITLLQQRPQFPQPVIPAPTSATLTSSPSFFPAAPEPNSTIPPAGVTGKRKTREEKDKVNDVDTNLGATI